MTIVSGSSFAAFLFLFEEVYIPRAGCFLESRSYSLEKTMGKKGAVQTANYDYALCTLLFLFVRRGELLLLLFGEFTHPKTRKMRNIMRS